MHQPQLRRRLSVEQVKVILTKYVSHDLTAREAMAYLGLGHTRFYELVAKYGHGSGDFSLAYQRHSPTHIINPTIKSHLLAELAREKATIIDNPAVPTTHYNYSYLQALLRDKYGDKVSLTTIINRARAAGYWTPRPPKKIHDREVITKHTGELIQHDSSHHLFAPDAGAKWYLITSLDDYSRLIVYADFWLQETAWHHIMALEQTFLRYGLPFSYYADQHAIFRYVKDRDKPSPWANYAKFTDDIDPQWKQVMNDCGVKVIYALSPQAKGKVERSYGWLQDHVVRTCVREGICTIEQGRAVLKREVETYNTGWVHGTTGEVPIRRFERALKAKQSLWREFKLKPQFQSAKDIFCLRAIRTVDAYRSISFKGCAFKVPGVPPRQEVELRLRPDLTAATVEVRFWYQGRLTGTTMVSGEALPVVRF